jgi:hypothetical protein
MGNILQKRMVAVSAAVLALLTGGVVASASAGPADPGDPITKQQCTTVATSAGTGTLCAEISHSTGEGGGYWSGRATLSTDSTILSTAKAELTLDGSLWGSPLELEFHAVNAHIAPQLKAATGQACAYGGAGIDSKDYQRICVSDVL